MTNQFFNHLSAISENAIPFIVLGVLLAICIGIGALVGDIVAKIKEKARIKAVSCSKCGSLFSESGDVTWQILSSRTTKTKIIYRVRIHCKCNNCGAQKVLVQNFDVAHLDDNGDIVTESIEEIIYNYIN